MDQKININYDNKKIRKMIKKKFKRNLVMIIDEINTEIIHKDSFILCQITIPNDQDSFQNWLYK